MAHVRSIVAALDREHGRPCGKPHGGLKALPALIAPEARGEGDVARFVELVLDVPDAIFRELPAEHLRSPCSVLVQLDGNAHWRVAMPPRVDEPVAARGKVVRDRVLALAVRAVRAGPRAGGSGSRRVQGPIVVPQDGLPRERESRGDVVLSGVRFGLVIDPLEVSVRWVARPIVRLPLLEPEADLHVIPKQLRADGLVDVL